MRATLLLNASFEPLCVISARRALVLVLDCCHSGAIPASALTLGDGSTQLLLCASTARSAAPTSSTAPCPTTDSPRGTW